MKLKQELFKDFDVYGKKYTYDEMKTMVVLQSYKSMTTGLLYEDLVKIANAIYRFWLRDEEGVDEVCCENEWLNCFNSEEEGYIQSYADRVAPDFIVFYRRTNNEKIH